MFLRRCYRSHNGRRHGYWALVESVRTQRGPRQKVVAYLGDLNEAGRAGVRHLAGAMAGEQADVGPWLFDDGTAAPRHVEVDTAAVQVGAIRGFGGPFLAWQVIQKLGLRAFLAGQIESGKEQIGWEVMALVLVILRLLEPSSELRIAEHLFERTALDALLGIDAAKVNDDRLYRALDKLLPHRDELQKHLKGRMGELFGLKYDLLLYDVTSTYFEGQCAANPLAQRGYSRDQRPGCKQVCIALVVSRCGMPVGYELFAGNRTDITTVEQIVTTMEKRYGQSERIWVMDRGMSSEANIAFLKQQHRRYIIGTPKAMLKKYQQQIVAKDWMSVREGLEVKLCKDPDGQSDETFILCRSADRAKKEQAMHARFELRIEEGLKQIQKSCQQNKQDALKIAHRVGRLMGQNTRAAGAFKTEVNRGEDGRATLCWEKVAGWREWANLSEGCYLLRSNVSDWPAEELWKAYIQLTEAEGAFRIHKSDLELRPVWHQKQERVEAHILVCFLAYVLWKTLGAWCRASGLGEEPRKVLDELSQIRTVEVSLPTRCGRKIRRTCISTPTEHQAILLQRLGMQLPKYLTSLEHVVKKSEPKTALA